MASTVLIVDDNSRNIEMIGRIVEELGHRAVHAPSGDDAVRLVTEENADVVVLDVMMQGLNGYDTCRRIRGVRQIPVIIVTAASDPQSVARAFGAGAADYVRMPLHAAEIAARLNHQLGLQSYQRDLQETNRKLAIANEELTRALKEVERLAMTDPLTGLLNRRAAMDRLQQEERRTARHQSMFSLLMADLDHFKLVNDAYGHDCGDEVLRTVTRVLREGVRGEDVIARWGGEEFLVMLPQTGLDGALATAEKLRAAMEQASTVCDGKALVVTITFGVAVYDPGVGVEQSINRADEALYRGKQAGRNRVVPYHVHPE